MTGTESNCTVGGKQLQYRVFCYLNVDFR